MSETITSYDRIRPYGPWSLRELVWGVIHDSIDLDVVREFAAEAASTKEVPTLDDMILRLDGASAHERKRLMRDLALVDAADEPAVARKWLVATLADLYDRRDAIADPLEEIERIYADFDYPECMESLVRYMPSSDGYDPTQHSVEQNVTRLLGKWEMFIADARQVAG